MSPWEKHQNQFVQHVGVGDVEVVFERGYRDVAVELWSQSAKEPPARPACVSTHILLHVFLAGSHRGLPDLESHLCRRIGDEAPEPGGVGATTPLGGSWLVRIAIPGRLRLLGCRGRW